MDTLNSFLNRLEGELQPMPHRFRLAFGASCCERAFPNYVAFLRGEGFGEPGTLRRALDRAWDVIEGAVPDPPEFRQLEAECRADTPDSDDYGSALATAGQEASFCVQLLLQACLDDAPSYIVRIARFMRDTIDHWVQDLEKIDAANPERERLIEGHSLMREELERERRDLAYLKGVTSDLAEFKRRATQVEASSIGLS